MIRVLLGFLLLVSPLRAEVPIQQITSPGGISAWLVEEHSIPFTALEIRFRGGANLDPEGKRGVTNLMMALLEEGTGDLDSRAFAAAREALAASFEFDAGDDSVSVSAKFLTENRDAAIALLRRALVEPNFDEISIERVRRQVVANIRSDAQDPGRIAGRTFGSIAFAGHPYATSLNGTEQSVSTLSRDDLFSAKDRALSRDRLFVTAVGDITPEALGQILDTLFSDLPVIDAELPDPVPFAATGGILVEPFETPQSTVVFGQNGINRHDDDFFAAFVLNHILGAGGFTSRLTEEVREKRGLTYGISSFLVSRDYSDYIYGQFASDNARVAEAISIVREEWQHMAGEGVSADELDAAITFLTGAYPLRFDGNESIANILVNMQIEGLTPDYITSRNDNIRAVTREDVARVARRLLDADDLFFVVVGQPDGL